MITIASASAGRLIPIYTCIYGPRYLYNCNFFPLFHRRRPTRKRLRLRTLQVNMRIYICIYNTMSGVTDPSTRGNFKYFFSSLRPQHTRAYTVSYCDHFSLLLASCPYRPYYRLSRSPPRDLVLYTPFPRPATATTTPADHRTTAQRRYRVFIYTVYMIHNVYIYI